MKCENCGYLLGSFNWQAPTMSYVCPECGTKHSLEDNFTVVRTNFSQRMLEAVVEECAQVILTSQWLKKHGAKTHFQNKGYSNVESLKLSTRKLRDQLTEMERHWNFLL